MGQIITPGASNIIPVPNITPGTGNITVEYCKAIKIGSVYYVFGSLLYTPGAIGPFTDTFILSFNNINSLYPGPITLNPSSNNIIQPAGTVGWYNSNVMELTCILDITAAIVDFNILYTLIYTI